MFKIYYSKEVKSKIKLFIDSYRNKYLETFTDTGLFYENLIRDNYINNSKEFKKEIFDSIDDNFTDNNILWKTILSSNTFRNTIIVWNYRLFIKYFEKWDEKVRLIEDIEFHKK